MVIEAQCEYITMTNDTTELRATCDDANRKILVATPATRTRPIAAEPPAAWPGHTNAIAHRTIGNWTTSVRTLFPSTRCWTCISQVTSSYTGKTKPRGNVTYTRPRANELRFLFCLFRPPSGFKCSTRFPLCGSTKPCKSLLQPHV